MAVFDDTRPWDEKLMLYPHQIDWQDDIPIPNKADAEKVEVPQAEPLRLECEHFLNCIRTGEAPITDGHEGLRVLRILKASQQALDAGVKKVYLKKGTIPEGSIPKKRKTDYPEGLKRRDDPSYFQHPTAVVDDRVSVGAGTKIWHFSHVLSGSKIGVNCNIGQNVVIGPDVNIGPLCKIQNNVCVYKGVTLEAGVFCGPSMVFTNVFNPRAEIRKMDQIRPTLVRKGATIGANATIVCGVTIGRYAFIGAGAVVTKDVPDFALFLGNPAARTGWVCKCAEKLPGDLKCAICGAEYQMETGEIEALVEV
jgi:UDP-2-acetamido-3-amino-2,3-dideoxy-glucuronate N-acetyltransferase